MKVNRYEEEEERHDFTEFLKDNVPLPVSASNVSSQAKPYVVQ